MLRSSIVITYKWDHKVVTHSLWIESLLIKVYDNGYSQDKYYNISRVWENVSFGNPKNLWS